MINSQISSFMEVNELIEIIQVNIDLEQEEPAFCNYLIRDNT